MERTDRKVHTDNKHTGSAVPLPPEDTMQTNPRLWYGLSEVSAVE
jgi:hypothetical protein